MNFFQLFQLILIAAIWGASHVLVRFSVPILGPEVVAWSRVAIAALFMFFYLRFQKQELKFKENFKIFLVTGFLMAALPFLLFAWASLYLPAAYLSILNSTSPIFAAVFSSVFLKEEFGWKKALSIALGISGVYLMEAYGSVAEITVPVVFALLAGLLAAASYATCAIYVRRKATHVPSEMITAGNNRVAAILLFPFLLSALYRTGGIVTNSENYYRAWACVLVLGILCSATAFILFYRLIKQLGAFRSMLVAFLMPVFGILWSAIFLGEEIKPGMIVGAVLIIGATALFVKKPAN
jgi:drug/metabolite transporter (DMT)-like permease